MKKASADDASVASSASDPQVQLSASPEKLAADFSRIIKKRCPAYAASSFNAQKEELEKHGYSLGHYIGEGSSAIVRMATIFPKKMKMQAIAKMVKRKGHNNVAVKIIELKGAPREFLDVYLQREITILNSLPRHESIMQFIEHAKTDNYLFIITELCDQGDLLSEINFGDDTSAPIGLDEDKARKYFRQLCRATLHCHRYGYAHRDLKLENMLLDQGNIKLSDFGFGIPVKDNTALKIACGSYAYAAPEVLTNKTYDAKTSDVWSLGIILYTMVNGRVPYDDDRIPVMDDMMRKQKFIFSKSVSQDYSNLVHLILQHGPTRRATLSEILRHPWLRLNQAKVAKKTTSADSNLKGFKPPYKYSERHSPVPPPLARKRPGIATILVQQHSKETVMLRSRAYGKNNNYVLAVSSTIRGGKPPKLNSSRLATVKVPKALDPNGTDPGPKYKDVGVGPCISQLKKPENVPDPVDIVKRANSMNSPTDLRQFMTRGLESPVNIPSTPVSPEPGRARPPSPPKAQKRVTAQNPLKAEKRVTAPNPLKAEKRVTALNPLKAEKRVTAPNPPKAEKRLTGRARISPSKCVPTYPRDEKTAQPRRASPTRAHPPLGRAKTQNGQDCKLSILPSTLPTRATRFPAPPKETNTTAQRLRRASGVKPVASNISEDSGSVQNVRRLEKRAVYDSLQVVKPKLTGSTTRAQAKTARGADLKKASRTPARSAKPSQH